MSIQDTRKLLLPSNPAPDKQQAISKVAQEIIAVATDAASCRDYLKYHGDRLALDLHWSEANFRKGAAVCEVGAAPFFLTKALESCGIAARTVDYPSPAIQEMAQRCLVDSSFCNVETDPLPFPDASFDEVLLNEVFEHLRINLIFTLREIHRVLRPDGRLWLSTPNLRSLKGIYNFLIRSEAWSCVGSGLYETYRAIDQGIEGAGHVREYTAVEVANFLLKIGFTQPITKFRGDFQSPPAALLTKAAPSLRPYFSIIASKAATDRDSHKPPG